MFNDKEKNISKIETLIGEKCTITGSISGSGLLKIDGVIDGDIFWDDDVIFGNTCKLNGNLCCINAYIDGTVLGNITCKNMLTIQTLGKVKGDILVKKLLINEGGILDGKCTMSQSENNDYITYRDNENI